MIVCKCGKVFTETERSTSVQEWAKHRDSLPEFERSLHEWYKTI